LPQPRLARDGKVHFIQEGSGSHFDPDVVKAFLACHQKFSEIAERFADPVPAP
jgi:putative two-component system response regulator